MALRVYRGVTGKESVGLRFRTRQPFLDGYENPRPIHNYDPRPLSQRINSEILRQERIGRTARRQSFTLIPDRGIFRKMGHRTFYRLFGLHYFARDDDPETSGVQKAINKAKSRIFFLDGQYKISTTVNYFAATTLNKWYMGIHLEGETAAGQLSTSRGDVVGIGAGSRGAYFTWTGTSGGTILQTSPNNKYPGGQGAAGQTNANGLIFGQQVENLGFDSGAEIGVGSPAGIGLDLTTQETGVKTLVRNVWIGRYAFDATGRGNFFSTVGCVLDGTEDGTLDQMFTGGLGVSPKGNAIDLSWYSGAGNVGIFNSEMAGVLSLFLCAQTVSVYKTTFNCMKSIANQVLANNASGWTFTGCYMANDINSTGIIQLNSKTIEVLKFIGCQFKQSTGVPFILGAGTIKNLSMSGCVYSNQHSPAWSSGAPTLTKQSSDGTNYALPTQNAVIATGAPFTSDANGNF